MRTKPRSAALVEVVTAWGDRVLSVRHLRAAERFNLGDNGLASSRNLSMHSNPQAVVSLSIDGRCRVDLPPAALFAVEHAAPDEATPRFERVGQSGATFELAEGSRARCQIGALVFTIRVVRDERPPLPRARDAAWTVALASTIAVIGSMLLSAERAHRALDDERLQRPSDEREARLHALIARSQPREHEGSAQQVRKAPKPATRARSLFCLCESARLHVSQRAIPPGPFLAPIEPPEDLRPYAIHALVLRPEGFEESAFSGAFEPAFVQIGVAGWLDAFGARPLLASIVRRSSWSLGAGQRCDERRARAARPRARRRAPSSSACQDQ